MPRLMFQRPRHIEWEHLTPTFGRMAAEPFEKGLRADGWRLAPARAAVGNPGTAVVWVTVAGATAATERVAGIEEDLAQPPART